MDAFTKIILVFIYPLLVLGRWLNRVLKRDPLHLEPPPGDSFWIERGAAPSRASYFSEASELEGHQHGGFGRVATAVIGGLGRLMAPSVKSDGQDFRASAEREQDIPDEVYTLW